MITEMWRPVIGGEGYYEVSDLGRVRSLPRVIMRKNGMPHTVTGEVLKTHRRSDGRFRADLHLLSGRRQALVHRLVLEAFVGPEPGGWKAVTAMAIRRTTGSRTSGGTPPRGTRSTQSVTAPIRRLGGPDVSGITYSRERT